MRILIASDKYKGSLTAPDVAAILKRVLESHWPESTCDVCPIADGGEGTTEAMITSLGGEWIHVPSEDARGRAITASYGMIQQDGQKLAVMEMSAASGLAKVSDLPLDPMTASTFGTGLMMQDAVQRGASQLIIGIGGSATNDAGCGMARALGWRFLRADGQPLTIFPRDLNQLSQILPPEARCSLEIQVACDVSNPLLGPEGCTRIYGPQKGVCDLEAHEHRLQHLTDVVKRDVSDEELAKRPGAGAAGGLGYGLMVFGQAHLVSGFDLIAKAIHLEKRIAEADLIITGEGKLDGQTLHGKGPLGVAQMARRLGKKVVAFAGAIEPSPALLANFDAMHAIKPTDMPVAEAMARAAELLERAAHEALPTLRQLGSVGPTF